MTAPRQPLPLARAIAAEAYRAGRTACHPDPQRWEIARARYMHGHDAGFDHAPGWLYDGMAQAYEAGRRGWRWSARTLSCCPIRTVSAWARQPCQCRRLSTRAAHIAEFRINWSIIACPTPAWAARIFPTCPQAEALPAWPVDRPDRTPGPGRPGRGLDRA